MKYILWKFNGNIGLWNVGKNIEYRSVNIADDNVLMCNTLIHDYVCLKFIDKESQWV